MKKIFITTLILSITLFMVGCVSPKSKAESDTITEVEENIEANRNIEEELYQKFENKFSKIEKVLKDNGIEYELKENQIEGSKYDGYKSIKASASKEPGNFISISYNLGFNSDNEIDDIKFGLFLAIDIEDIKSNGFRLEDTMLKDISEILIKDGIDYLETNNRINELYLNEEEDIIINEYDNIKEKITVSNDDIAYTIIINP